MGHEKNRKETDSFKFLVLAARRIDMLFPKWETLSVSILKEQIWRKIMNLVLCIKFKIPIEDPS